MKDSKQHPGMLRHATSLRVSMIIFGAMLVVAIGGTLFFVYTQVYSTIGDVRSLILLSENFGFEIIDFQRLEHTQTQWESKHATSTAAFVRDPFYAVPSAEISTSTEE